MSCSGLVHVHLEPHPWQQAGPVGGTIVQEPSCLPSAASFSLSLLQAAAVSLCKFRVAYVLFVLREATVVVTLPKSGVPQPDGAALLAPEALIVVLALGRLWLSIMVQDARFITVVQSVLAALYLACALFTDLTVLYRGFCVAMVVFSILICISTTAIEKDAKHCIKAQLEASASQQYSAAANHLLSSMCDAVVCLSDKYEVIEGDRSLACLLQRREGLQPCLGMSFREIITSDADVATFESLMEQPCSDFARTVHITLRDSYSIAFPVQVYHAPALSADKRRIHILGLRESGDVLRSAPATHIAAETMRSVQAGALGGTEPSQTSGGGLGSISENETGDSEGLTIVNLASLQSRSLRAAASANTRQAALWLEPISLRMRAWTPAFADLFGASAFMQEDRSFLSLVQEDEHVKFLQRFQDAVHCKLEGEEEEEHGATIQVAVCGSCHGPVLLHCTVHFADCCISEGSAWSTPEGLDRDDESDGLPVVVLTVRAVRRLRSKRKRKVEDRKRQAGNSKAPANDVTFPAQTSRTQILIRL
eukprot:CAMPEP_0178395120 /NCGR_PEP_ID=MMETSP0689_2-20121128/13056_1 /TAXON_ID=160604 /ORGANISM="Amphidinium massartii, Strain CS-259" /LENGTH=536 /DNA_ID=CAMNT_0020015767 /DNA_START=245 /DNA_END=1856 /DNA_ORIENTATION=-